jgi:RNAse (barnase) inhibitor barstar
MTLFALQPQRGLSSWFRKSSWFCVLGAMVAFAPISSVSADETDSILQDFRQLTTPILQKYCSECHGDDVAEAEINFQSIPSDSFEKLTTYSDTWQRTLEVIETAQMPPQDSPQCTTTERERLVHWIQSFLAYEAKKSAGDPGPVVLRRLSNSQYTYTLRDLTGVTSLDPAREFPVDGAAGEGFTNTGNALVMSPALVTKYLDAAKDVARHAVLLPDTIEFSPNTTSADWTNEKLDAIRQFYNRFTSNDSNGGSVNLQGIVFDTNQGGRLPLKLYLRSLLANAKSFAEADENVSRWAREQGLSSKYLLSLRNALRDTEPNIFLDPLRAGWQRAVAGEAVTDAEIDQLVQYVSQWQNALFRFTTVGHIGKVGGPKRWLEATDPLNARANLRFAVPAASENGQVEFSLLTSTAGDQGEKDFARWDNPRLIAAGRRELPFLQLATIHAALSQRRERALSQIENYLDAVAAIQASRTAEAPTSIDPKEIAHQRGLDAELLAAWLNYLGISVAGPVKIENHLTGKLENVSGYAFVSGYGVNETPIVLANSSENHVRIPGNSWPKKVVVHPSPTLEIAVGWLSPATLKANISGEVTHAHPECGNGVTWRLELRRQQRRQTLAEGISHGGTPVKYEALGVDIHVGDALVLLVGPRDGNHSCDLTKVDLNIADSADANRVWDLGADVSPDIMAGNPHADRIGNANVWHFFTEPLSNAKGVGPTIPAGSLLSKWLDTQEAEPKKVLATQLKELINNPPPADPASPDGLLRQQLTSLQGALLGGVLAADSNWLPEFLASPEGATLLLPLTNTLSIAAHSLQNEPIPFGRSEDGKNISNYFVVKAPESIFVSLPAELVAGYEFVADVGIDRQAVGVGSVQAYVAPGHEPPPQALQAGTAKTGNGGGTWTDGLQPATVSNPILVDDYGEARAGLLNDLDTFRNLFPPALCYVKIVPVDEVVTLTLFYREDDHLKRLMLNEDEAAQLDRLWDQLHFVSRDALKLVDAYAQLMEYATQDADPSVFEPLRKPIMEQAKKFEQQLLESEPKHIEAVLQWAQRAYRRSLHPDEALELRKFYETLRSEEIPHEESIGLMLARVFVAPDFLYRLEVPPAGASAGAVSQNELASRLSYFLWSSMPDQTLLDLAAAGELAKEDVMLQQAKRMLQDPRSDRLASEFATYWLHIANFDEFDEKSDQFFPTFRELREPMQQETLRFFTHLFRNDGSVLDILGADYTFVNEALAKHYGIPGVTGDQWQMVKYPADQQRSGILGQGTVLSSLAGASRTSPILRGNWVSEVLLGEKLPKPPKGVPPLPDDVAGRGGLTMRELVELHGSNEKCAVCHKRIDPLGFAMEKFDAIGRFRNNDELEKPIDVKIKTIDGVEFEGVGGLRDYLLQQRRDDFVKQFCKKLLGFALGRGVQLSDRGLLDEMKSSLEKNDYRFSAALEPLLRSPQFREIRGRDAM